MTEFSPPSFEELFTQHKDRVYRLALRLVRNAADAEDVAQRVFLRVYERMDTIRRELELSHWLYRITMNLSIDLLRARKRGAGTASLDEGGEETGITLHDRIADPSPGQAEQCERSERAAAVQDALTRLPEKYRSVLILREFEGMSYDEVATLLGVSEKVVGVRLIRAKQKLLEFMKASGVME
jgi:RNA polymerase sigma-70 factor (ECF subfamily)